MNSLSHNQISKIATFSLLLNSQVQASFYPRMEVMDMEEFHEQVGDDWRTLNCWECFEAKGKICHDEDYLRMTSVTNSRDPGDQVCCRSGFDGEYCNNDDDHVCSQPAYTLDTSDPYYDILSPGNLNHQMFAFCTTTEASTCGLIENASSDMKVRANTDLKTVSTNEVYFKKGAPHVRSYDSCYYEVGMDNLTQAEITQLLSGDNNAIAIDVTVTKAKDMNVYIYGGADRFSANMPIVPNNEAVTVGQTYRVDSETGFFILAYPNEDVPTDFEFTYSLSGYYQVELVGGQPMHIDIVT